MPNFPNIFWNMPKQKSPGLRIGKHLVPFLSVVTYMNWMQFYCFIGFVTAKYFCTSDEAWSLLKCECYVTNKNELVKVGRHGITFAIIQQLFVGYRICHLVQVGDSTTANHKLLAQTTLCGLSQLTLTEK